MYYLVQCTPLNLSFTIITGKTKNSLSLQKDFKKSVNPFSFSKKTQK